MPDLPTAGTWYTFTVQQAQQTRIDPVAGVAIRDNSGQTTGKYKWADALGETITIVYDSTSNHWFVIAKEGTWSEEV